MASTSFIALKAVGAVNRRAISPNLDHFKTPFSTNAKVTPKFSLSPPLLLLVKAAKTQLDFLIGLKISIRNHKFFFVFLVELINRVKNFH